MNDRLKFSVIIPTHNRHESLRACLQSLSMQNYPKSDYEVIVVDDACIPPIQDSIQAEFPETNVLLLRIMQNEGPSAARNRGVESAHGCYLAFTDDDCVPDPNWLANLESALAAVAAGAVGGPILDGGKSLFSSASHAVLSAVYEYYNAPDGSPRFFGSGNLAVPAVEFRNVGGFNPEFRTSEDREFCARWLRCGYRLVFASEAAVVHRPPNGCGRFLRRHYHYGKGAYRFWALQAKIRKRPMELEPRSFYWQLLRHPMRSGRGVRGIAISFLVAISQLASLLGFLLERRRFKQIRRR